MPRYFIAASLCILLLAGSVQAQTRLVVLPAHLELANTDDRHRLLVSATAADGSIIDVTSLAQFTSEKPNIAEVSGKGECKGMNAGSTRITVRYKDLVAMVPITVKEAAKVPPPSFVNEVQPLFTKIGCNQGSCHGKGSGQNGFRLSLRGYAPEWDHEWLTREFGSRRINSAVPEASLLLRKPLGQAPHEGGKVLVENSREYHLLLDWIKGGTPGVSKDEPALRQLTILPGNRVLKAGQKQQLLVRAQFDNGQWRDVTWLCKFDSNDVGVATVDANGLVDIERPGETPIRATFQGHVAVVVFTAPHEQAVKAEPRLPRHHRRHADIRRGAGIPERQGPGQTRQGHR
jgi:hypothetical protein